MPNPEGMDGLTAYITKELKNRGSPKKLFGQLADMYVSLIKFYPPNKETRTYLMKLEKKYPDGLALILELVQRYGSDLN